MSDEQPSATNLIRWPRGLRWECRGCGACCSSGFDLGPVEPEVIEVLRAHAIEERWAPAGEAPWAEERTTAPRAGKEMTRAWFLRQKQGRCIFLRDDFRCAIHAELGPSFKPGFCREFPYHLVHDPRGVVAIVRPDCGGFHHSAADGPSITEEDVKEALALPRSVRRRVFAPPRVSVLGVDLSLDAWLDREAKLIDALESLAARSSAASLPQILETLRMSLTEDLGVAGLPTPNADRAVRAAAALSTTLEAVLRQVSAQQAGTSGAASDDRVAFVSQMAETMARSSRTLALPFEARSPELLRYVELQLRSGVMARNWQPYGSVEAGLGVLLFGIVFGYTTGGDELASFDVAYRNWLKLAGNNVISMVLARASPALVELFVHLC